jgi:hypothetical protein
MDLPIFLDIVIGLTFIYLILSLLASEIQEIIAGLLQLRAKSLKQAIIILLGGNALLRSSEGGTAKSVTNQSLQNLRRKIEQAEAKLQEPEASSNLELKTQALSDLDKLRTQASLESANLLTENLYSHSLIRSLNQTTLGRLTDSKVFGPSYIPSEIFATALIEILQTDFNSLTKLKQLSFTTTEILEEINISGLPDNLKRDLAALALRVQTTNVSQFKEEVAKWFDHSMERTSGVYKRDIKKWTILIGFLIALLANADTIHIVSRLSKEASVTNAISQQVAERVRSCPDPACITEQVDTQEFTELSLPIGWYPLHKIDTNPLIVVKNVIFKVIGWLITAIAISMGASFWFDVLNKIINVRYTGKKPPSSTNTVSKISQPD